MANSVRPALPCRAARAGAAISGLLALIVAFSFRGLAMAIGHLAPAMMIVGLIGALLCLAFAFDRTPLPSRPKTRNGRRLC